MTATAAIALVGLALNVALAAEAITRQSRRLEALAVARARGLR